MSLAAKANYKKCKLHVSEIEVIYNTSLKDRDIHTVNQEIDVLKSDLLADHNIHSPLLPLKLISDCHLNITVTPDHVIFDFFDSGDANRCSCSIPKTVLKQVLSDYLTICDSYKIALQEGGFSRLEAIDMGRRGMHNDAAEQLISLLKTNLEIDLVTASHLFALLATIHRSA